MIPRNEILYAPLQPQENGSLYERNFSEQEIKLFEQIYFECRLKPVFDRILRETEENQGLIDQKSPLSQARKIERDALSSNIVENEIIPFTRENYTKELGGTLKTPIGNVVMGQNIYKGGDAFEKMAAHTDRQNDIFKVKTTLRDPSIIIKSPRYQNGCIYAKVFDDSMVKGKMRQIFSVIVDNGKVISSYGEDHARIRTFVDSNIISPESLIWPKQTAATSSDKIQ
jgi:hypothetical protein